MRYIAVCSCGKDSLAMVLRLIEQKEPLDEVVFYDTGMEFGAIYRNWDRLCAICKEHNIKTVRLHPDIPFEEKAFEITVKNKDGSGTHKGYSWCGGRCRWGTTDKLSIMDKYCETEPSIVYVGIAADEPKRIEKERKPYKVMPLVTWGMTEDDCLAYCRERESGVGRKKVQSQKAVSLISMIFWIGYLAGVVAIRTRRNCVTSSYTFLNTGQNSRTFRVGLAVP